MVTSARTRRQARSHDAASRRVVPRIIVTLALAAGSVLALATAADAEETSFKFKGTPASMKGGCKSLGGALFVSNDGSLGVCIYEGGDIVCDTKKKGENCTATQDMKAGAVTEQIPELRERGSREDHTVPRPETWRQKVSVADLSDVVCDGLGGEFVGSDDGAFGACSTRTATFVCNDEERGKNCTGVADKKKHAVSIRKQIRKLLKADAVTPPSGPNQAGSPTTTGSTPRAPGTPRAT